MNLVSSAIRWCTRQAGYNLVRCRRADGYPRDFSPEDVEIIRRVAPFTKTSPERVVALLAAVRFLVHQHVPGAIVECGVWRGGSMMAAALVLQELGETNRDLYLYDTFEGMVRPTEHDVGNNGAAAIDKFERRQIGADASDWCLAPLDEVRRGMASTGYPESRIHYIKGKVEETLPQHVPEEIALLRLDTDWYESTKQELVHLYPRLAPHGVLIIDDYGDWLGARKAVDEYFAASPSASPLFLHRIDQAGRIGIKPSAGIPSTRAA